MVFPVDDLFVFEPKLDLIIGRLDSVGAVTDVSANVDAEVTSDSAWLRILRLGGTEHFSSGLDSIVTFPNHAADWA